MLGAEQRFTGSRGCSTWWESCSSLTWTSTALPPNSRPPDIDLEGHQEVSKGLRLIILDSETLPCPNVPSTPDSEPLFMIIVIIVTLVVICIVHNRIFQDQLPTTFESMGETFPSTRLLLLCSPQPILIALADLSNSQCWCLPS